MLQVINADDLDRRSYVIVIGGGAVLDAVGFAAAIAHRGIRLIPPAHDDSGSGRLGRGGQEQRQSVLEEELAGHVCRAVGSHQRRQAAGDLADRDFRCGFSKQ